MMPCLNCANTTAGDPPDRVDHGGSWGGGEVFLGTPDGYERVPTERGDGYGVRCVRSVQ
jgi:hypothetical protein